MSDILNKDKKIILNLSNTQEHDLICKISHALSVPERTTIMQSVLQKSQSIKDIADATGIPFSSVARHMDVLVDAQLVRVSYMPGRKGHTKYYSQTVLGCEFSFETDNLVDDDKNGYTVEMPVGLFSHCHVESPCGMLGKEGRLCSFDDPSVFFSPERVNAECLWFDKGFISYNFPNKLPSGNNCSSISFSFEICSETAYYNENWPSDITLYINDTEVTTFTSPGDFGGRRGKYTPDYWDLSSTQFGLLKTLTVNERGAFLDNVLVNNKVTVNDLRIVDGYAVKLTIGIKQDAEHKGGINLFGKNFGDYPQAIVMTIK